MDSDADETTGCTVLITLGSGQEDLTWDAGLVDAGPTGEDPAQQPSQQTIFLPTLLTSAE